MTTYTIKAPNGKTYEIEGPEGASQAEVAQAVLARNPEAGRPAPPQNTGIGASARNMANTALNEYRTGIAGLLGDTNEAARAGAKRAKSIEEADASGVDASKISALADQGEYLGALKEAMRQAPAAAVQMAPMMGEIAAGGRLGGAAGAPFGPVGAGVGAVAGAVLSQLPRITGSKFIEKAADQEARGENVNVEKLPAIGTAAFDALLNYGGMEMGAGALANKLMGKTAAELTQQELLAAEKLAQKGMARAAAEGAGKMAATMPGVVTAQTAANRAYLDKDLTGDDAMQEYKNALYGTISALPVGAVSHATLGRSRAREGVRRAQEFQSAQDAEFGRQQELAAPTPYSELSQPTDTMPVRPTNEQLWQQHDEAEAAKVKAHADSAAAVAAGNFEEAAKHQQAFTDAQTAQQDVLSRITEPRPQAEEAPVAPQGLAGKSDAELQARLDDLQKGTANKKGKRSGISPITQLMGTDPEAAKALTKEAADIQAELARRKAALDAERNVPTATEVSESGDTVAPLRRTVAEQIADYKARQAAEAERAAGRSVPTATDVSESGDQVTHPPAGLTKEAAEQWLQERRTGNEIETIGSGTKVNKPEMQQQNMFGEDAKRHVGLFHDPDTKPDVDVPQTHTVGADLDNAAAGIYRRDTMPEHQTLDTILRPEQATEESLRTQIEQLPENLTLEQEEVVNRLHQNLAAFAADKQRADMAAEWLHRLRLGEQVQTEGEATSRPDSRLADMQAALDSLDTGKRSETETLPTGETRSATQRDMFPTKEMGRTFNTPAQFQQYLGGEGLHKLRKAMGQSVQTMARALKRAAAIDKRLDSLFKSIEDATAAYHRHRESYAGLTDAATAAYAAAKNRLAEVSRKLEAEREPLAAAYLKAQQDLKFSTDVSQELSALLQHAREKVASGIPEVVADIAAAKEAMSRVLSEQMALGDKKLSTAEMMRHVAELRERMQARANDLERLNKELVAQIGSMPDAAHVYWLRKEASYNKQLLSELETMRELHKVYSAAKEKFDRLEYNQNRRVTVKREREAAQNEIRQTGEQLAATKKAAEASRREDVAAGEAAHTAYEKTKAERDAELAPVIEARDKRAERDTSGAVDIIAKVREAAAARAAEIKAALERGLEVPGTHVSFDRQRRMRNFIADAIPALKELARQRAELEGRLNVSKNDLEKPDLEKQIKSLTTRIDKIKNKWIEYSALMSHGTDAQAELRTRRETLLKQISHLESANEGGREEPGISKSLRKSRQNELRRRKNALEQIDAALSGQRGVERTPLRGARPAEEYSEVDVPEVLERIAVIEEDELPKATGKDRARLITELRDLRMQASGKLPPRKLGPVVRDTRNTGLQRTGSPESKAGENKSSPRNTPEQGGRPAEPRRPLSKHEMEEANTAAAEIESRKAVEENLKEEAAAAARAAEEARGKMAAPEKTAEKPEARAPKKARTSRVIEEITPEDYEEPTDPTDFIPPDWNDNDNHLLRKNSTTLGTPLSEQNRARIASGDVVGVLSDIANTSDNHILRRVAARVQSILTENGVKGRVVERTTADNPNAPGKINKEGDLISLNRRTGLSEESTIHEAVHAATMHELSKPEHLLTADQRAAKRELEAIMRELQQDPNFDNDVIKDGDLHEFVAESHADPRVQEYMRQKQWDGRSMWRKFVDGLLRMIGVKLPPKGNALDRALELSEKFMRAKDESSTGTKAMLRKTADYGPYAGSVIAGKLGTYKPDTRSTLQHIKDEGGLAFETGVADMHAPIVRALDAIKDKHDTFEARYALREAGATTGWVQQALSKGFPKLSTDSKGYHGVTASGDTSAMHIYDAVSKIPGGDAAAKDDIATKYMMAIRGLRVGAHKVGEGVTDAELRNIIQYVDSKPELKAALENVRKVYNKYTAGLVEFARDTGRLSKAEAADLLKHGDYVSMYRVRDGRLEMAFGDSGYVNMGDIANGPFIHALKGGKEGVMPISESLIYNTKLWVDAAMTNLAQRNIGYALSAAGMPHGKMPVIHHEAPRGIEYLSWKEEPKANNPKDTGHRFIKLDTEGTPMAGVPSEMLMHSLQGFHATMPAYIKWAGALNDYLRAGVTRSPIYTLRQLIRDPVSASMVTGAKNNPLSAIATAMKEYSKSMFGDKTNIDKLNRMALVQSNIMTGDHDDMAKLALQFAGGGKPGLVRQFLNALDHSAHNADAATRIQIYNDGIKQGLSEFEAAHRTRESMNYHKRGSWASVQQANRMFPFFNSAIQALNVTAKALQGKMPFEERLKVRQRYINTALMLGLGGVAYAASMNQDPEYKKLKPADKYGNFHIALPGTGNYLKVPVGYFEGGGAAWAIGQALIDAMDDSLEGKEIAKAFATYGATAVPGGGGIPLPSGVKQGVEWMTNTDLRTFQDIVPKRLQNQPADMQYSNDTPEAYKSFGALGLSPTKVQHAADSLVGQLATAIARGVDQAMGGAEGTGEKPEMTLDRVPVLSSIIQNTRSSEAKEYLYDMAAKSSEVNAAFNRLKKEGAPPDQIRKYVEDNKASIALAKPSAGFVTMMGKLNNDIRLIKNNPKLSGAEKTAQITRIEEIQEQAAQKYKTALKQAKDGMATQ